VEVDLLETDEGWSPYLSLDDAYKLDDVRESLRRGDLQSAAKLGRIFRLKPATIPSRGLDQGWIEIGFIPVENGNLDVIF
jgi:hypothetical protein